MSNKTKKLIKEQNKVLITVSLAIIIFIATIGVGSIFYKNLSNINNSSDNGATTISDDGIVNDLESMRKR